MLQQEAPQMPSITPKKPQHEFAGFFIVLVSSLALISILLNNTIEIDKKMEAVRTEKAVIVSTASGDVVYCAADAKLCPDGSYVSRTGPNCEFKECGTASVNTNTSEVETINTNTATSSAKLFKVSEDQVVFDPATYNTSSTDDLFMVVSNDSKFFTAYIYQPSTDVLVAQKKITPVDSLASSATGASGASDAVQFNPTTGDIIYRTSGAEGMGGCYNADGTCDQRVYVINMRDQEARLLYSSVDYFSDMILDRSNNVLYVRSQDANSESTINKIDVVTGEVSTVTKLISGDFYTTRMSMSSDGQFLYLVRNHLENKIETALYLDTINIISGGTVSQLVHTGKNFDVYGDALSPDGKKVAYYVGFQLYVFDTTTNKDIKVPNQSIGLLANYTVRWSADSNKVTVIPRTGLVAYYDLVEQKMFSEKSVPPTSGKNDSSNSVYPLLWSPSPQYILFSVIKSDLYFFDTIQDRQFTSDKLPIFGHASNVVGLQWF